MTSPLSSPAVLRSLEAIARVLRRLGLGSLVDLAGPRITGGFGSFVVKHDGTFLYGDGAAHMHYVEEVRTGREGLIVDEMVRATVPGATVLEGGVHLGWVTLQLARAVGPTGRVFAFEPNEAVQPLIRRSLERNVLADRVELYELALSDRDGEATLLTTDGGDTSSLFDQGYASTPRPIRVARADSVLPRDVRLDLVKLDIEGAELGALRGMVEVLERSRPGPVLFLECNPPFLERAGTSVAELLAWLDRAGFGVRWIDEETGAVRDVAEVDWESGYVNLRCERPPSRDGG